MPRVPPVTNASRAMASSSLQSRPSYLRFHTHYQSTKLEPEEGGILRSVGSLAAGRLGLATAAPHHSIAAEDVKGRRDHDSAAGVGGPIGQFREEKPACQDGNGELGVVEGSDKGSLSTAISLDDERLGREAGKAHCGKEQPLGSGR